MPPFNFCDKCKHKVLYGYTHTCSFNKDNEIADNLRQPDETEEADINSHETTGQHAENLEGNNRKVCIAAQRIGNPSQASTSSAPSSTENKELDGGAIEEPADSEDRPFAEDASFPAPDRKRKLDTEAEQPHDLRKVADEVPGPSIIRPQTIEPVGGRLYVCDEGTYRCENQSDFDNHYRKHTEKKSHVCGTCRKRFSRKSSLNRHARIHTGERPHSCDICGRDFVQKHHLTTHLRTHTGERPYECKKCKKGFSQSGDLIIHMRTHTKEKPYSCDICGKGFSVRGSLRTHSRIHSGERPFPCPVCDRRFTDQSNLRRHVLTHGTEPYRCSECQQTFRSNEDRNRHFIQEHQQRE